jgi:osmotically-inducible protein OsmY
MLAQHTFAAAEFSAHIGDLMGWFDRLFPHHDSAPSEAAAPAADATTATATAEVPIERQGPDGNYDQSGLAKRVVKAFDDAGVEDAPHLYVSQTGTTVVFKGNVHKQEIVDQLVEIAKGVAGTAEVDTSAVHIA